MTDEELEARARALALASMKIKWPVLVPQAAREAITGAARIVVELARREVQRNAQGE